MLANSFFIRVPSHKRKKYLNIDVFIECGVCKKSPICFRGPPHNRCCT